MGKLTALLSLPIDVLGLNPFKRSYKAAMAILDEAVLNDALDTALEDYVAAVELTGSKTHDFASTADAAQATTTVTVTGAAVGDYVLAVSLGIDVAGATLTGYVSAADTVTVVLQNESGGVLDLASTTLRVLVRKHG